MARQPITSTTVHRPLDLFLNYRQIEPFPTWKIPAVPFCFARSLQGGLSLGANCLCLQKKSPSQKPCVRNLKPMKQPDQNVSRAKIWKTLLLSRSLPPKVSPRLLFLHGPSLCLRVRDNFRCCVGPQQAVFLTLCNFLTSPALAPNTGLQVGLQTLTSYELL